MPVTALTAAGIGAIKISEEQRSNEVNRVECKDRQLRRGSIARTIYRLARQQRELQEFGNAVVGRQRAQMSGDIKIVVAGIADAAGSVACRQYLV